MLACYSECPEESPPLGSCDLASVQPAALTADRLRAVREERMQSWKPSEWDPAWGMTAGRRLYHVVVS